MAKNPSYVRLADHLAAHGCQIDPDSGWGISGYDVRQFPESESAQAFVKNGLARGVFETASKAEWDEVHEGDLEDDAEVPTVHMVTTLARPENKVQHQLRQKRSKLAERQAARASEAEEAPEDAGEDDYRTWGPEDLKAELSSRGLSTSGSKGTLVKRLEANDKAVASLNAEEEDDEEG